MDKGMQRTISRTNTKKSLAIIVAILLVIIFAVGGTIAYLVDVTESVTNTFNPAQVTTRVTEVVNSAEQTKTNVCITNTGDVDAYIRAAVVVTWQNEEGDVLAKKPTECKISGCNHQNCGGDYVITYNTFDGLDINTAGWFKRDDFYYWNKPVSGSVMNGDGIVTYSSTGILIAYCKQIGDDPKQDIR